MKTAKKAVWAAIIAAVGTGGGLVVGALQDADGLTGREIGAAVVAGLVAALGAGWKVYDVKNAPA